ncbi:hypothetical protein GCM10008927_02040 [Amylibacter ulvae]|uniref:YhdP central domain-containing protein n=1 Tax=Paramylibacter ulvae TaxID=1651968 RepID=A0ABQ3CT64_9RHOB|nr:AsmA-like C-terminal region-containing protein [Amylibacter ulvae]GHA41299.1 hypothetical protein GCM10008927_02040 [Amylibacter ulvae]
MTKDTAVAPRKRKHPFLHFIGFCCSVTITAVVIALLFIGFLYLRFSTGPVEHPKLVEFVENRINREINGSQVEIGQFQIHAKDLDQAVNIQLRDVALKNAQGANMLSFPLAELAFSSMAAVRGAARPEALRIQEMNLSVIRHKDGSFNFQTKTETSDIEFNSIDNILNSFAKIEWLQDLQTIEFVDTKVRYDDRFSGQQYTFDRANVSLTRTQDLFDLHSDLELEQDENANTTLQISLRHRLGADTSQLKVGFDNASPVQLAGQVRALGWLRGVDAVASGSFLLELAQSEIVKDFSGVLDLTNGRVRGLLDETTPKFDRIKAYFNYQGDAERFTFDSIEIDAPRLKLAAVGDAILLRDDLGEIEILQTDLNVSQLNFADREVFSKTLAFQTAHINADFHIGKHRVHVSNAFLKDEKTSYFVKGSSWINEDIWQSSYQFRVDEIGVNRLISLWPIEAATKTRDWIAKNITKGMVRGLNGHILLRDGSPNLEMNFLASDVDAKFMRTMPPLQSATGVGRLTETAFSIQLADGHVTTPRGENVDLAGSTLTIPQITAKPALAKIDLKTQGSILAALELLNVEQFQFIDKVGLQTDVAQGNLRTNGTLHVPLAKTTTTKELFIEFNGDIQNLSTEKLVAGKTITAKSVALNVDNAGMSLQGPIRFDGIDTTTKWHMEFGQGKSQNITSTMQLDQASLRKFNVNFPKGSIDGRAPAKIDITLNAGQAADFQLQSNLKGLAMNVPTLGWRKGASSSGDLRVSGSLGQNPKIDQFAFSADGLAAKGTVDLGDKGTFKSAQFDEIKVGNWFDTSATVVGRGAGASKILLNGGRADMRRFQFGNASGGGAIDVSLDQLVITDAITLHNLRATRGAGASAIGKFTASLNNQANIAGTFQNGQYGTSIRIQSSDAGGTLRGGGVMQTYRGGDLILEIAPQQQDGNFRGKFSIDGGRMVQSNGMTSLMNAMSVVGLLQQMKSKGIHFDKIIGNFAITPKNIQLQNISAVGPSMGMTVNGWYNLGQRSVDIEGVVTPLYVLNGAFQRVFGKLFGRQKGEGLFSFTYTMTGDSKNPKVGVNPFSILTPGIFREIFRQNQPQPSQ